MTTTPGTPWHRSLGVRVFALTALAVTLVLAVSVSIALWFGGRVAREAAKRSVTRAAKLQSELQLQRLDQLGLMAQVFAGDPALSAYLVEAKGTGDVLSMIDLLDERREDLGYDFAIVLDHRGFALARTDGAEAAQDLSADPLVASAQNDFGARGVIEQRGRLYDAAIVPIAPNRLLEGFLLLGFELDQVEALALRELSDSEAAILVAGQPPTLATSTLEPAAAQQLVQALAAGLPESPRELELAGRRFIAVASPLQSPGERPIGYTLSLAALAQELLPFRRLSNALLGGGALAILAAATLLYLFATRALRPLSDLAHIARDAAHGNYDQTIDETRPDEVGELSRALSRLLSDLRERRDTELYLSELARSVPAAERASDLSFGQHFGPRVPAAAMSDDPTLDITAERRVVAPSPAAGAVLRPGSVLGDRFEIEAMLGEGGMGVVYRARDRSLGEVVALKTVRPDAADPAWLDQLKDELRLARRVTHPNVLRTYDFGAADRLAFITMEYVRGITLRYLLKQSGRLPYSAGLRLARELVRGLDAAHRSGVLHRDIKPENLLIEPSGNAKLTDFGLARPLRLGAGGAAALAGTPGYLAPELLAGAQPSVLSDIYSCGVVFYEVFAGAQPFAGTTSLTELLRRVQEEDPAPPRSVWPELPLALERLIARCLARDPAVRPPSAQALLDLLEPLHA